MDDIVLCRLDELDEPGSRGFSLDQGTGQLSLFLVRHDGAVHAYRNSCPHTGAPLEWMPDSFLDLDKAFIECAMHGALFRIDDGYCLRGPCAGQGLEPLSVDVVDGMVRLMPPARDTDPGAVSAD